MAYKNRQTYLYGRAKDRARSRGIPFQFTSAEWIQWWIDELGPDWEKSRGPLKDQYVMARKSDKGPYAAWNVRCITSGENVLESNQRRILITSEMLKAGIKVHNELYGTCNLKPLLQEVYIAMRRATRLNY